MEISIQKIPPLKPYFVWDLGDIGIGLMTIFNMIALFPLSKEALRLLREYQAGRKKVTSKHD